jgi:formamidopyrimidine-DNA glycosylase
MPEGHTIHRHARMHSALLAGKRLRVTSPQGRFEDAPLFAGRKLQAVLPHGKHLMYRFSSGYIHVHLGMYGKYVVRKAADHDGRLPDPTPTTRMRFATPKLAVDLTGPTACEAYDDGMLEKLMERLGPDPLKTPGAGDQVGERVRSSKANIGTLLMDQSVLAGVGNAYRAELLYRAGIDPRTPGNALSKQQWAGLWQDTVELLNVGVKHGHILCVEPKHVGKTRWRDLAPDERFWVYKQQRCRKCGEPIEHFLINNRSVYVCATEQKRLDQPGSKKRRRSQSRKNTSIEKLKHHR